MIQERKKLPPGDSTVQETFKEKNLDTQKIE